MGSFISMIPTEGIGLCIFAPIVIMILVVLALKLFNFQTYILPPKKKANFLDILKNASKAHAKVSADENSIDED